MALFLTFVLFASVAPIGFTVRSTPILEECPDKVGLNVRDDCTNINGGETTIVPSQCCDHLRWCNKEIYKTSQAYAIIIEQYSGICGLKEDDVDSSDGNYRVVDNTRICTSKCLATPEIQNKVLMPYDMLESCTDEKGEIHMIKMRHKLIQALEEVVCPTTSNTTKVTGATTPIITKSSYINFTGLFEATGINKGRIATVPGDEQYMCCCHNSNEHCKLQTVSEKCIGSGYDHWNNGKHNSCIVPYEELPESLTTWTVEMLQHLINLMTRKRQAQNDGVGGVKKLTLHHVMTNIKINYLFNKMVVNPDTGFVTDEGKKLEKLQNKNYFPKSLKLGYKIREINAKIYNKIEPKDKEQYKAGLFGSDLIITYLEIA